MLQGQRLKMRQISRLSARKEKDVDETNLVMKAGDGDGETPSKWPSSLRMTLKTKGKMAAQSRLAIGRMGSCRGPTASI